MDRWLIRYWLTWLDVIASLVLLAIGFALWYFRNLNNDVLIATLILTALYLAINIAQNVMHVRRQDGGDWREG
jgi:predicted membrane-bound mannosyltransferase